MPNIPHILPKPQKPLARGPERDNIGNSWDVLISISFPDQYSWLSIHTHTEHKQNVLSRIRLWPWSTSLVCLFVSLSHTMSCLLQKMNSSGLNQTLCLISVQLFMIGELFYWGPGADLEIYSWGGKRVAGDVEWWHLVAEVYTINIYLESP